VKKNSRSKIRTAVIDNLLTIGSAISIAAITGVSAHAAAITIGITDNSNSLPFGSAGTAVRYQQIYGASAFSGISEPISINSLSFFAAAQSCGFFGCFPQAQSISTGVYTVSLSTTGKAVNGVNSLSTASLDSNVGNGAKVFFSGSLSNTLTINGLPFIYDRSLGNLLMDVTINSQTANGSFLSVATSTADQMARAYSTNGISGVTTGSVNARSIGLVTEFGYSTISPVPEASNVMMLLAGLLVVGGIAAGKRRSTPTLC
jgi:hypothetical protein